MAIQSVGASTSFTSRAPIVQKSVSSVIPEIFPKQAQSVVKESHKFKSGLMIAIGAVALGAMALLGSCTNPVQETPTIENPDPVKPDPTTKLTPAQQSIVQGIANQATTLNAIVQAPSTARSAADFSTTPKTISYTDDANYVINLTLDETKLASDTDTLVFKGTAYDPSYNTTSNFTRTYYNTGDSKTTKYLDSDARYATKDITNSSSTTRYIVKNGVDSARDILSPTTTPGKVAVTSPDGTGSTGYITGLTYSY